MSRNVLLSSFVNNHVYYFIELNDNFVKIFAQLKLERSNTGRYLNILR